MAAAAAAATTRKPLYVLCAERERERKTLYCRSIALHGGSGPHINAKSEFSYVFTSYNTKQSQHPFCCWMGSPHMGNVIFTSNGFTRTKFFVLNCFTFWQEHTFDNVSLSFDRHRRCSQSSQVVFSFKILSSFPYVTLSLQFIHFSFCCCEATLIFLLYFTFSAAVVVSLSLSFLPSFSHSFAN